MTAWLAMTRDVSPSIAACELTHLRRQPIDVGRARAEHAEYERALRRLGCHVERLPADEDLPDSVFIEDTALVFDELAVITRPGARSRRRETAAVAAALAHHRRLVHIEEPGTMDGGDVLVVGRSVFVGRTSRTNDTAIEQLRIALAPYRYTVTAATVHGCLHLKSAATAIDDSMLLVNRRWIDDGEFAAFELLDIDPAEPMAANIVRVGTGLLYASAFPRTLERLEHRGCTVACVDVSELAKAEGALTCCSLIFRRKVES